MIPVHSVKKTEGVVHDSVDNLCINRKAVWNCSACDVRSIKVKSAQIVAPNVYWETPLNHNTVPLPQ